MAIGTIEAIRFNLNKEKVIGGEELDWVFTAHIIENSNEVLITWGTCMSMEDSCVYSKHEVEQCFADGAWIKISSSEEF